MQYRILNHLVPISGGELTGDRKCYVEVLDIETYRNKYSGLVKKHLLLQSLENVSHCKVDVFKEYILGTLNIPEKYNMAESGWSCGFYMDREKLLIIGEEDRIGKIIEIMEERQVIDIQTPAQVLFEFLEALVADDVEFMDDLEKMLDLKENEMSEDVNEIPKDFEKYILSTRKELMVWNRYYKQLNEMGGVLSDSPNDIVDGDAREMFRFFTNKVGRLQADSQNLREYTLQIHDIYQSQIDVRQNKVMQFLTIVTTIFMPLTLITGWYGMNFQKMPELGWAHGYGLVIVLVIGIILIEWHVFKKKKWLYTEEADQEYANIRERNQWRTRVENIAITVMIIVSAGVLIFSFIHNPKLDGALVNILMMGRATERVFAVVLILLSYNLYKRKHMAWIGSVAFLILNILIHASQTNHWIANAAVLCELVVLCVLVWGRKDFFKESDQMSVQKSVSISILLIFVIIANAGFSQWSYAQTMGGHVPSFWTCLYIGVNNIFGQEMGILYNGELYPPALQNFIFWFSWICIIAAVIFMVRPFIKKRKTTEEDLEHARDLVNKYGQNPSAYLTLEDDKTLFFGKEVDGVIAYGTVGDTVVINGDPICAPEDFEVLLQEFDDFCRNASLSLFYLSVTDKYMDYYKAKGYAVVKCGEEARFDLASYDIKGKKGAKMRAHINKATRAGITVREYDIKRHRDPALDAEFDRITGEWLDGKTSGQLGFTLGGVGLNNPMDKRYFYGIDAQGVMQGFIVFCPFQDGYMADVTRRAKAAPGGIMQKIMYEAFQVFKEEGVKWGSMGLAPLANLKTEGEESSAPEKLLDFIYNNLNNIYGFKNLYRTKAAYSPSTWEPGYFVYSPKVLTPQMVYAVVAIQNPQGIWDYIRAFFKGAGKKRKSQAEAVAKAQNQMPE